MNVREATREDVGAVRRVAERSWETDYPDIVSRETASERVEEWYGEDRIRAELDRARTALLVGESGGDVVGFAHAVWGDTEGTVLRLYVETQCHPPNSAGSDPAAKWRVDSASNRQAMASPRHVGPYVPRRSI